MQLRLDKGWQREQFITDLDVAGSKCQIQRQREQNNHQNNADKQSCFDALHVPQNSFLILWRGIIL